MLRVAGFLWGTLNRCRRISMVGFRWLYELIIFGDHSNKNASEYFR